METRSGKEELNDDQITQIEEKNTITLDIASYLNDSNIKTFFSEACIGGSIRIGLNENISHNYLQLNSFILSKDQGKIFLECIITTVTPPPTWTTPQRSYEAAFAGRFNSKNIDKPQFQVVASTLDENYKRYISHRNFKARYVQFTMDPIIPIGTSADEVFKQTTELFIKISDFMSCKRNRKQKTTAKISKPRTKKQKKNVPNNVPNSEWLHYEDYIPYCGYITAIIISFTPSSQSENIMQQDKTRHKEFVLAHKINRKNSKTSKIVKAQPCHKDGSKFRSRKSNPSEKRFIKLMLFEPIQIESDDKNKIRAQAEQFFLLFCSKISFKRWNLKNTETPNPQQELDSMLTDAELFQDMNQNNFSLLQALDDSSFVPLIDEPSFEFNQHANESPEEQQLFPEVEQNLILSPTTPDIFSSNAYMLNDDMTIEQIEQEIFDSISLPELVLPQLSQAPTSLVNQFNKRESETDPEGVPSQKQLKQSSINR